MKKMRKNSSYDIKETSFEKNTLQEGVSLSLETSIKKLAKLLEKEENLDKHQAEILSQNVFFTECFDLHKKLDPQNHENTLYHLFMHHPDFKKYKTFYQESYQKKNIWRNLFFFSSSITFLYTIALIIGHTIF